MKNTDNKTYPNCCWRKKAAENKSIISEQTSPVGVENTESSETKKNKPWSVFGELYWI